MSIKSRPAWFGLWLVMRFNKVWCESTTDSAMPFSHIAHSHNIDEIGHQQSGQLLSQDLGSWKPRKELDERRCRRGRAGSAPGAEETASSRLPSSAFWKSLPALL